jgi:gluconolactonase
VQLVSPEPNIINSNGATNFRGQLIFTGEGQGADIAPTLYLMNPKEPYNSSG